MDRRGFVAAIAALCGGVALPGAAGGGVRGTVTSLTDRCVFHGGERIVPRSECATLTTGVYRRWQDGKLIAVFGTIRVPQGELWVRT